MTQIQDVRNYKIVIDKDLSVEALKKPFLNDYLKKAQSSQIIVECENVVSTDIPSEHFKSLLTHVIKNKYCC